MLLLFLQTRKEEKEETNRFPFNSIQSIYVLNSFLILHCSLSYGRGIGIGIVVVAVVTVISVRIILYV